MSSPDNSSLCSRSIFAIFLYPRVEDGRDLFGSMFRRVAWEAVASRSQAAPDSRWSEVDFHTQRSPTYGL